MVEFYVSKPCVGLYIDPEYIELAVVRRSVSKVVKVEKVLSRQIASRGIGQKDQDAIITNVLKDFFSDRKIPTRNIFFSLSGNDFIFRTFSMMRIPASSWHNSIRFEAQKHIPFSEDKVFLDYLVLNPNDSSEEMYVLLVCSPKETILRYMDIFSNIDVTCSHITSSFFAMVRFGLYKELLDTTKPTLIMNVHKKVIGKNSIVASADMILFYQKTPLMGRKVSITANEEEVDSKFFNEIFLSTKLFNSFVQQGIKDILFFEGFSLYKWDSFFTDNFSLKVRKAEFKGEEKVEQVISIGTALTKFYAKEISINLLESKDTGADLSYVRIPSNFFVWITIGGLFLGFLGFFLRASYQFILFKSEKKLIAKIIGKAIKIPIKKLLFEEKILINQKKFLVRYNEKWNVLDLITFLNEFLSKEPRVWLSEIKYSFGHGQFTCMLRGVVAKKTSVDNLILINNLKALLLDMDGIKNKMMIKEKRETIKRKRAGFDGIAENFELRIFPMRKK